MGFFGFSFSWRRALGISAAKARISRATGIPLSASGREQKIGRMMMGSGRGILPLLFVSGRSRRSGSLGCIGSLFRLAMFAGIIYVAVTAYRSFSPAAKPTSQPTTKSTVERASPPSEPTFEDILEGHN